MRASRSWPRSSVPSGWAHDGPARRALKSIASIGTRHTNGPSNTATTIASRTIALAAASGCRRKRRQVSRPGEKARPTSAAALAIGDAGVEPDIKKIGDQVEQDHEAGEDEADGHDDRRVIGQNRADQQGTDTGDAKNLLGDDGASEQGRHLQCDHG